METVPELEQVLKLGDLEEIDYIVNRAIGDDKKAQESESINKNDVAEKYILNFFLVLDKTIDVKPDPLALLSLEKEGIDVSFLKAFDPSQEIKEDIPVDQIMEQLRRVFILMYGIWSLDTVRDRFSKCRFLSGIFLITNKSIILPELAKLQDKRLLSNRPVEYIDNFELKAAELIQKVFL